MPMLPMIAPSKPKGASAGKIIAVDFDGTLCVSKWPEIGDPKWSIINELKRRQHNGDRVILWTCREGVLLNKALAWCREHGIVFDAVNNNLPERISQYGNNPRKVSADEYWDDKAVTVTRGGKI